MGIWEQARDGRRERTTSVGRFAARVAFCLVLGLGAARSAGLAGAATSLPADDGGGVISTAEEVYAFSDRFPVDIIVLGQSGADYLIDQGLDLEGVDLSDGPHMPGRVRANINQTERASLEAAGFEVIPIVNESKRAHARVAEAWRAAEASGQADRPVTPGSRDWPSYAELQADLQAVAAAHPDLVQLISIGNSVQGRAIWFMKISDSPTVEENEPEFKFSSSIHGNEVVGMELCRRMIHYLVDNYGTNPTVTNMVNNAELWFCPLHNPDGYVNGTRYNAHGVDLNRHFPDPITDPNDSPVGREIEIQHMMNFGYGHNFILSANYHCGALVMNIPWDCQHAQTPDHAMIWQYAEGYSILNPPMWSNPEFPPHGVVLGSDWYVIHGGMQDWCYNWRNEIDITIEISNTMWPAWSTMDTHWANNRDAMLYYMQRVLYGVKGQVYNAVTGTPLSATVMAVQIGKAIKSDPDLGDYHRMLLPGTYTFNFSCSGFDSQTIPNVVVTDSDVTILNVGLFPTGTGLAEGGTGDAARLSLTAPAPNPLGGRQGPARMILDLPQGGPVSIGVFDLQGREVRRLSVSAGFASPGAGQIGAREVTWDGRTASGRQVAPGIYWVRAEASGQVAQRRVVVVE
jgi:hypothetical protein